MASGPKSVLLWMVVMLGMAVPPCLAVTPNDTEPGIKQLSFTEFMGELEQDNVRDLTIVPGRSSAVLRVTGFLKKTDSPFSVIVPSNDEELYEKLGKKNVNVVFTDRRTRGWWLWTGNGLLPTIALVVLGIVFMREMRKGRARKE